MPTMGSVTAEFSGDGRAVPAVAKRGTHEAVLALFGRVAPGRILDAGAGRGALSQALRDRGFRVSACGLGTRFGVPGIPFERVDLLRPLPYADASFDAVAFIEVIEHLENPFAPLREFARILVPGGHLVISTPNYASLERRLVYLLTGNLARPGGFAREDRGEIWARGGAAPHINPINLPALAFALDAFGFEVLEVRRNKRKLGQLLLWPLALAIRAYGAFFAPEARRAYRLALLSSAPVLMGGNTIIVLARKKPL